MNRPLLIVAVLLLVISLGFVFAFPQQIKVDGAQQLFDVTCTVPVRNIQLFDFDIAESNIVCDSVPSSFFSAFSLFSDEGNLVMKIGGARDSVDVSVWEATSKSFVLKVRNVQAGERIATFTLYNDKGAIVDTAEKRVSVQ